MNLDICQYSASVIYLTLETCPMDLHPLPIFGTILVSLVMADALDSGPEGPPRRTDKRDP